MLEGKNNDQEKHTTALGENMTRCDSGIEVWLAFASHFFFMNFKKINRVFITQQNSKERKNN